MTQSIAEPELAGLTYDDLDLSPAPILWQIVGCFAILVGYGVLIRQLGTPVGLRTNMPPLWAWVSHPRWFDHPLRGLLLIPPILLVWGWLGISRRTPGSAAFVLMAVAFAFAFDISVCLVSSDFGPRGKFYEIVRPFDFPGVEFYGDVGLVRTTGQFLHDFADLRQQHRLSLHGTTHPPGPILFFHYVRWCIGPGLMNAALSAIALSALAVIPAFLLARRLYGVATAKIAVGILAVTPSLVLHGATSMDAVYVLPMVACIWLYVEAIQAASILSGLLIAVCLGLCMAVCAMLTFATCCLGMLMGIHAMLLTGAKRRWHPWLVLMVAGSVFVAAFVLIRVGTGYDLLAVARNSMESDTSLMGQRGGGSIARYLDFVGANFVAFLIGCGAALTVVLVRQLSQIVVQRKQEAKSDPFLLAVAITLTIMATSMLFRLETERVWLFMMPLVACACSPWIEQRRSAKLLAYIIGAQAVQTILMQNCLFMLW